MSIFYVGNHYVISLSILFLPDFIFCINLGCIISYCRNSKQAVTYKQCSFWCLSYLEFINGKCMTKFLVNTFLFNCLYWLEVKYFFPPPSYSHTHFVFLIPSLKPEIKVAKLFLRVNHKIILLVLVHFQQDYYLGSECSIRALWNLMVLFKNYKIWS